MTDSFDGTLKAMMSNVAGHDARSVTSSGKCVVCGNQIISGCAIVDSSDRSYHPEHFVCSVCKIPLTTDKVSFLFSLIFF